MKFTNAKPFSILEIQSRFNKLSQAPLFWNEIQVEDIDKDGITPDLELSTDRTEARDQIPRKTITKQVRAHRDGYQFTFKSFVHRVFFTDTALKPLATEESIFYRKDHPFPRDYLHSKFRWHRKIKAFDGEYNPKEGRPEFLGKQVAKHWLSDVFGFFQYKGNVVQINPADLMAVHFFMTSPKYQDKFDFNEFIREVRIIPLDEADTLFTYNQFRYYLESLMGLREEGKLLRKENELQYIDPDHYLARGLDDIQYLENRTLLKDDLINSLRPLGEVVVFGQCKSLLCLIDSAAEKTGKKENLLWWRNELKQTDPGLCIFTAGGFAKAYKFDLILTEGSPDMSPHLLNLGNYLRTFVRKKDNELPISEFKDDLLRLEVYSEAIIKTKSFINDVVVPDAKRIGFTIDHTVARIMNAQKGMKTKTRSIKVSQPKTGRRKVK